MREIKFRAWDMKKKQMLTIFDSSVGSDWYLPSWKENYKVMQYTGLTDKNGTEIYEGDIISYNKSREVVYFDTSLRIPCFTTGIGLGSSTKRHPYVITKRHEVIGNIYENPELLK